MGVEFEIVLYAPSEAAANEGFAAAFARIAALDRALSDYNAESELSQLSAAEPGLEIKLSDDLWNVLSASQSLSQQTDGAFDITIGPLTKLWRRARRQKQPPAKEHIDSALAAVGYKNLVLDERTRAAKLLKPNMRLDAGGIAKGYAAEEALSELKNLKLTRALVRASGDIAIGNEPPGEKGWKIGIAPLNPDERPTRFVILKNCAISTSGDARQHLAVNGKRYSHIIDPRTGWGIEGRSSVTVIAPTGIAADSLASAVSLLGPTQGLELIAEAKCTFALIVSDQDGKLSEHSSPGFARFEAR